jgi:signal transduction histidine kinase/ligand-binding sensor domain-containing protein
MIKILSKLLPISICFLFINTPSLSSQSISSYLESGTKMMEYYPAKDFNGHNQNWSIVQDSSGIIYFANTDGFVLQFDGVTWRKTFVANESIVRSLAITKDGVIFVGAQDELGYLAPIKGGHLVYKSLLNRINSAFYKFGDVWKTVVTNGKVYFLTRRFIFVLPLADLYKETAGLEIIESDRSLHNFYISAEGQLIILQRGSGLTKIVNGSLELIEGGRFYQNDLFAGILPFDEKTQIIGTRNRGLFIYDGKYSIPFKTGADEWLKTNQLYNIYLLSDGNFLLGSKKDGALIMDKKGRVLEKYDMNRGLENNTIWAVFQDKTGSIWLCLNKGITRIDYMSPFSFFNKMQGLEGSIHDIVRFNSKLYISTGSGLFALNKRKSGIEPLSFAQVDEIKSGCWALLATKQFLLAGTNKGVYKLGLDGKVRELVSYSSWGAYRSLADSQRFFIGLDKGLASIYLKKDGSWIDEGVWPGIEIEARTIAEDKNGTIWIGSSYQGIARLNNPSAFLDSGKKVDVEYFSQENGLPSSRMNFVKQVGNSVQFCTIRGVLKFNGAKNKFEPDERFRLFNIEKANEHSHVLSARDPKGNMWLNLGGRLALTIFSVQDTLFISKPFYDIPENNIQAIFAEQGNTCWIGGADGLVRFSGPIDGQTRSAPKPLIRAVYLKNDSLFYNGGGKVGGNATSIEYKINDVRFEYVSPYFNNYTPLLYQYKLEGYDKNWSREKSGTSKGYTNLWEGNYTFKVRGRNKYGEVSAPASFAFTIETPWQRTVWAYLIYLIVFMAAVFIIVRSLMLSARRKAFLEHKKEEETRKKLEEELRGQIAADFHDELGTRITRISLFSEILKNDLHDIAESNRGYLNKISENADGLYHETRDFIWQLDPNKDALVDFIARVKKFADDLFENSEIHFELQNQVVDPEKIKLNMEWRRHLIRIFKEAIHNALKYSGCKNIFFDISLGKDQLIFLLQDDGRGFDTAKKSDGNGLKNMQKRANKIEAGFNIQSTQNGTTIKIRLHLKGPE